MKLRQRRPGTSIVELLMFLGFFALCSGVLIGVLVASNEQRTRQQTIALVEQEGMQLIQMLTRRMRRGEQITYPAISTSGSVIVLQLADETQDPTIIAVETGAIRVAEGNSVRTVSSNAVTITDLLFRNTSVSSEAQSVTVALTVNKVIPLPAAGTYSRTFDALVVLFPDHQRTGNGCGCPVPVCSNDVLTWGVCNEESCEDATVSLPCG